MTRLSRSILRLSLDLKGRTRYQKVISSIAEIYENIIYYRPNFYYDVKRFIENIPLFTRLAWNWRSWDSTYTINVLVVLLKRHGAALAKNDIFIGSKRVSRRCYTAAGKLDRAYNDELDGNVKKLLKIMYGDTCMKKQAKYLQNQEFYDTLYNIARKRSEESKAVAKREAWEYLNKYIEHIWD